MSNEIERLRAENRALIETVHQRDQETKRWAWIATGASAAAIILMIAWTLQNQHPPTPAAPPRRAEVAASVPPTATPAPKPPTPPAPPADPAEPEGPPATLPDTESCEEILRPNDFLEGEGKFGAVCGEAVYRIDSSEREGGVYVHKELVLLVDVTP